MTDIYIWDTYEQQQNDEPYGFIDFPQDFLSIYLDKRQQNINQIKMRLLQGSQDDKLGLSLQIQKLFAEQVEEELSRYFRELASQVPTDLLRDDIICVYTQEELQNAEQFNTGKVIRTLFEILCKESEFKSDIASKHYRRILKKAETRKLVQQYDADFINTSTEEPDIESYSYLGLTLALYSNQDVQSLSTLLKVNDYLLSETDRLISSLEKTLVYISLSIEKKQVEKLAAKKGVLK